MRQGHGIFDGIARPLIVHPLRWVGRCLRGARLVGAFVALGWSVPSWRLLGWCLRGAWLVGAFVALGRSVPPWRLVCRCLRGAWLVGAFVAPVLCLHMNKGKLTHFFGSASRVGAFAALGRSVPLWRFVGRCLRGAWLTGACVALVCFYT